MDRSRRERGRTLSLPAFLIVPILLFVMFLWGGSFIAIKVGLRYLTPSELLIARFVPSALMLLPIGMIVGKRSGSSPRKLWKSLSKKEMTLILVASFLTVPGYHTCLNYGEMLIPAGWASLVISLNPVVIAIFAAMLLHEMIGPRRWTGVALAFSGLVFIALTHEAVGEDGVHLTLFQKSLGFIITFGAVISWGGSTTISKKLVAGREPLEILGWTMTLGALWTTPFLRWSLIEKLRAANLELWGSIAFLSIGCTVIGFAVWYWILKRWQASKAGAFIYLVPIFALLISRVYLGEPLDWRTMIGASGVLGGVILAATAKREPQVG